MVSQSESGTQPVPKRSLFKKPAWAKPAEEDEALQLFSRSKEIFPDIVAENERRRKNLEGSKPKDSVERTDSRVLGVKRRRIPPKSEDSGEPSSDEEPLQRRRTSGETIPQSQNTSLDLTSPKGDGSPSSTSKSHKSNLNRMASLKSKILETAATNLGDSEDEAIEIGNENHKPPQIHLESDSDVEHEVLKPPKVARSPPREALEEEEEFPEYVAKAREGVRRKGFDLLDLAKSNAHWDSLSSDGPAGKLETTNHVFSGKTPHLVLDPIVLILVTSRIEGTRPLILKRKLSQRLKDVRIAWCDRQVIDGQPVSDEAKRQIFLTWRENKVFDLTTCKAMGLRVDSQGKLRSDGEGFDAEGRVHLEAWTEDIFDEFKRRKAAERKRRALNLMEEEDEEQPEPGDGSAKEEAQRLKIILKSKDYEEFKVMVFLNTLMSRMISVFRIKYKIPADVEISLYLDGEKLDPQCMAGDADLEDLTTIDVHVG